MKCGDLLIEAKAKFGQHGQWLPWLERECGGISDRTARRYMQLARGRAEIESKLATVADLTLTEAVKLIGQQEPDELADAGRQIGEIGRTKAESAESPASGSIMRPSPSQR